MNGKYNKDLGLASIEVEGIKILNLLQNPGKKQPLISAYLGARYSRSSISIEEIIKEVLDKNIDAAKRLESIFEGYGHRSVGQMALSSIFLEEIPLITATKIFNIVPDHAGQERSTRYQNYSEPKFRLPIFKNKTERTQRSKEIYLKLMYKAFDKYKELYSKTYKELERHFKVDKNNKEEVSALRARVLDTVRYLLPLGTHTSMNLVTNAANLSELISKFKSSTQRIENTIGDGLYDLLRGDSDSFINESEYVAEVDNLITHALINLNIPNTLYFGALTLNKHINTNPENIKVIEEQIERYKNKEWEVNLDTYDGFEILVPGSNLSLHLIENLYLLINPHINLSELEIPKEVYTELKGIFSKVLTHRDTLGNIAQSGAVVYDGYMDIGMLRDINRHRSLERYIPLIENRFNIENELKITNYNICPYLEIETEEIEELKQEYISYFEERYSEIREWIEVAKEEGLTTEEILEYGRYLLPLAHNTRCRIGGSLNDIQYVCSLRTRPGGHIGYRILTYNWLKKLVELEPLLEGVLENIPEPKYTSYKEFIDRS